MKKLKLLSTILFFILSLQGLAQQPFTAGNIVVYRIGDGSATLTSSATKVYLDEYTPDGVLIQSILMPIAASGSNNILTGRGSGNSEGMLNLSADGRYLVVPGINTAPGGSGSTATIIGLVDFNGAINTSTAVTDYTEGSNIPKSAISDNGNRLWFSGTGAIRYATTGSTSSTLLYANGVKSYTNLNIVDSQLYVAGVDASSNNAIFTVGIGLPTTTGQNITILPGLPSMGTQTFAFADLDPATPGADVLYIADQGTPGGILKFSLVGGSWVSNGNIGTVNDRYGGLTLRVSGNTVTLFATRRGANSAPIRGGELVKLTDNSGYNGTLTGTPTVIASVATTNTMAFRGVAKVPLNCSSVLGLQATNIAASQATISWTPSAGGTNYEYSVTTSPNPPTSWTDTTATIITVTGLTNGLTYYAYVRTKCSAISTSEWSNVQFITSCKTPAAPLLTINITGSGVTTVKWSQVFGASSYEYFISTNQMPPLSGIALVDTSITLINLNPVTQYYIHVRSNCGAGAFSNWVTKSFTTGCFLPTIHLSMLPNHVGAIWNKINNAIRYEYALTYTAAKPLSGIYTIDTSYTMDKLLDGSAYYLHVRSICNNGTVSEWSTVSFHIQGMQIYPNPVNETLFISVNGVNNTNGQIYISDAMGRIVKRTHLTSNSVTIDMKALGAGIYLVRYDDGQNKYTVRIMKQ
ncbi:MAG: T9SS type A sorting domain-containing protein [Bacteroidota bacterium]|nr:T9SS type A sorting domain-containing protein [Bacteroidota bacterium]